MEMNLILLKKVEVAPPPKENAWSRRPRIEPNANNGDASHEDGAERRAASPGNNEINRERQSRQSSRADDYNSRSKTGNSADRSDRDVNEGRRAEFRDSEEIHSTRSGSRDKKEGSNRDQDFSHNRDDTNANDRVSRKDHSNEDQSRMPKYEEKPIPNFVASNKYAYLNNDDDPED